MSPRTFKRQLTLLQLQQKELAAKIGVTEKSVSRWATGQQAIPAYVEAYLGAICSIKRMRDMAAEL